MTESLTIALSRVVSCDDTLPCWKQAGIEALKIWKKAAS